MGSHWRAFFENGVDDVVPRLPEMLEKSTLTSGYGDTLPAPRQLPDDWQDGKHLAWPDTGSGAVLSIAIEKEANTFCTILSLLAGWLKAQAHA